MRRRLLMDKTETVEREAEEKKFISSYNLNLIGKDVLKQEFPSLNPMLDVAEQDVKQNFEEQVNNIINVFSSKISSIEKKLEEARAEAREAKAEARKIKELLKEYWPYILALLRTVLEYKQTLIDAPYIRYVSASFAISSLIQREISKTFGKPKDNISLASYYIFLLWFTGILTCLLQSLDWSIFYGAQLYPVISTRLRGLMTQSLSTLTTEFSVQFQTIAAEGVGIGISLGKEGFEKIQNLFHSLIIIANSYHMAKLTADGIKLDLNEIKNSPDGEEIVEKYKRMKSEFKIMNEPVSPTTLITNKELIGITQRFTKIELLSTEVALYVSQLQVAKGYQYTSFIGKGFDLIKRIKNELENPNVNIASSMLSYAQEQIQIISPSIDKHLNYRSLNLTAKNIDNNLAGTIEIINADIDYSLNKIAETWANRYGGFLPLGPSVNTLMVIPPSNPSMSTKDITIHASDYLVVFFVFAIIPMFLIRQSKKVYKYIRGQQIPEIEILEQRIRRHRK